MSNISDNFFNNAQVISGGVIPEHYDFEPKTYGCELKQTFKDIPHRDWIMNGLILKGYISAIFAPGGVGKSLFQLALAVSIASNRDFLSLGLERRARVLLINNEDDENEFLRRLAAIVNVHNIDISLLDGMLWQFSGYGKSFTVARMLGGQVIREDVVDSLDTFISENEIDVVLIDPFVSTHNVNENDNNFMDKVIQEYKTIAHKHNVAINMIHHTTKSSSANGRMAGSAESGRGASAIKDALRAVVTLAPMLPSEVVSFELLPEPYHKYIRLDSGKNNYAANLGGPQWFIKHSVRIDNGEYSVCLRPVHLTKVDSEDRRRKWNPDKVAKTLELIFKSEGLPESLLWSKASLPFCKMHDISNNSATDHIKKLPSLRISQYHQVEVNGQLIGYRIAKDGPNNGWVIYRRIWEG